MSHSEPMPTTKGPDARAIFEAYSSHNSGHRIHTDTSIQIALHEHYPSHNISSTTTDLIKFAHAGHASAKPNTTKHQTLQSLVFEPAARRRNNSDYAGKLKNVVSFGLYDYTWKERDFQVFVVDGQNNLMGSCDRRYYILAPKASASSKNHVKEFKVSSLEAMEALVLEASAWAQQAHEEFWIYDQGRWTKDAELYSLVQDISWDDLILDEKTKQAILRDVTGFFDARDTYRELGTPWKRGLIFHGSPGNGKTSTAKALMKSLTSRPEAVPTLVVKTLSQRGFGPQMSLRQIFAKARQAAPCLLLFEDIDSLVTEEVRSYFFNEVDGLEDNGGILMVGSTNSLENLHPGLSKRPSRFDRKYHFDNPSLEERTLYCEYWRQKLKNKPAAEMPDQLPPHIASITQGFSFAYMKEAYVASLLTLARKSGDVELTSLPKSSNEQVQAKGEFGLILEQQVASLREDIGDGAAQDSDLRSSNSRRSMVAPKAISSYRLPARPSNAGAG